MNYHTNKSVNAAFTSAI